MKGNHRSRRPRALVVALLIAAGLPIGGFEAIAQVPPGLTVVNTIDLSTLLPPSIDASGITYLGDNLLIADSEVDEEKGNASCLPDPLPATFQGVNLWEITLTGVLVNTGLTHDPSNPAGPREPTGLATHPNGHVFYSNDALGPPTVPPGRVYEMG
ncbi:MAG: hypothetical protein ACT4OP_10810, partial [Actinomycetota bacterium]